MNRIGWAVLAIIVLAVAAFASMVRIGGGEPNRVAVAIQPIPAATFPARNDLLAVPVAGVARDAITDSWGDTRAGGARVHHGTDVIAPGGTPVVAVGSGRIEKLFHSALGGITLYQRSADRHWLYYYAHLAGYAPGVHEGQVVHAGQPLGFVGDTGDAGAGNFHLHFGLSRVAPDGHWWQGEDVDPYPRLAGPPPRR